MWVCAKWITNIWHTKRTWTKKKRSGKRNSKKELKTTTNLNAVIVSHFGRHRTQPRHRPHTALSNTLLYFYLSTMCGIRHLFCRERRDLSNMLRVPGTKWCGKGYSAKKYAELGGYSKADRCCRQHDKSCPFWIMGFETKYGFFNWRINTLMHCKCDDRYCDQKEKRKKKKPNRSQSEFFITFK